MVHWIEFNFCGNTEDHEMHIWGAKKTEDGTMRYRCTGLNWKQHLDGR